MLVALLIYCLSLIIAFIGARLLMAAWRQVYRRTASKKRTRLDTTVFQETEKPTYYVLLFVALYLATRRFSHQPGVPFIQWLPLVDNGFFTLITLSGAHTVIAAIRACLHWYRDEIAESVSGPDNAFLQLVDSLARVFVYFIAGTMVLARFGITITSLLATAGVASLALAFAAQETLGNMLAGFTIMLDRPFRIGDRVELADGSIGDVVEIGLRSTKVLSFDNTLIVTPNKNIAGAKVVNHSYPDTKAKVRIEVGVAYGTDIARVKQILCEVLRTHPQVLQEPPVAAYFTRFGESALHVLVVGYINNYREMVVVVDELNMEIKRRFEAEAIEMPFPQRDVHVYRHE